MSRRDGDWIDVMQVCRNGHKITSCAVAYPEYNRAHCPDCGAETITACQTCHVDIPGHHHIDGVLHYHDEPPPAYCHSCGDAYPWTAAGVAAIAVDVINAMPNQPTSDRVFIVHGHDDGMKQSVARTITDLGLNPVILHEQPNRGKTLIEKFERNSDVGFAVVLLSPDDVAYVSSDPSKTTRPRARQNVVLELGYFVASLGRERVLALKRGNDLEVPSDFSGVIYTPYDDAGNWKVELVRELRAVGYNVDANKLI